MSPFIQTCAKCGEQIEDQFDVCWKCGVPTGTAAPAEPGEPTEIAEPGSASDLAVDPMRCPRCPTDLKFVGTKRFHEGSNWGLLGEIGEAFVNREHFDVYLCPRCGRVELFVDGIGEEFRPKED